MVSLLEKVTGLERGAIDEFTSGLRGSLITPEEENYDQVRQVYNGMIDKWPAMIAQCVDVADVVQCVDFARENQLPLAIRGGGHSAAGMGICDDGLVIDLSRMRGIRVDPDRRTVRVEGGCTWGDVDHATHAYGLAVPSGIIGTTGVAGLTLGGGSGHLTRKYGLTIDSLLSADMVLADGQTVTASEDENQDLFWAIRGGGGNFGVVTSFLFRAHPVNMVRGGPSLWNLERSPEVLRWYRDFIDQAPEDLSGFFALMTVPPSPHFPENLHMKKVCGAVWCYCGPEEKADEVFAPVREFGPPALFGVQDMPFPVLQSAFDALYPPGLQWYWRADFFHEISDKAIEVHNQFGATMPTLHSGVHIYPINGAAQRVGKDETAFSYRDANFSQGIVGVDPDPANADKIKSWAIEYADAIHPYSAGGAYVNFMMEEGQERVQASYRENYNRLVQIKGKYDPDNLFHINQNIRP
ncbi:MAG: FAD-binding oxidoreductase [Anaerolineales bacterium]|jgi:FAD/FMN-containing dehydrogenase